MKIVLVSLIILLIPVALATDYNQTDVYDFFFYTPTILSLWHNKIETNESNNILIINNTLQVEYDIIANNYNYSNGTSVSENVDKTLESYIKNNTNQSSWLIADRIGIGTIPTSELHVIGEANVTGNTNIGGVAGIGGSVRAEQLDVYGKIMGGTNAANAALRVKLDLAGWATSSAVDFDFPNNGYLRVAEYSLKGTNDIFFQAVPATSSGYGFLETWQGAGMVVGTGGNTAPVIFQVNRVEKARVHNTGMDINGSLNVTGTGTFITLTSDNGTDLSINQDGDNDVNFFENVSYGKNPKLNFSGWDTDTDKYQSGLLYIDSFGRMVFDGDIRSILMNKRLSIGSNYYIELGRGEIGAHKAGLDETYIGLQKYSDSRSPVLHIINQDYRAVDQGLPQQYDPTVCIHSINSATNEMLCLTHNNATGYIFSGKGGITLANKTTILDDLNVTGNNATFQDVTILGTLHGGSDVKIAGINITNNAFMLEENRNSSSRFTLQNINSGENATAVISAINDVGDSMSIGIGSSNFMIGSKMYQNVTALFSKSRGDMVFANFYNKPFRWLYNPSDDNDADNLVEIMRLDENGLNLSSNLTADNVFLPQYIFSHTNATIPVIAVNEWTNVTFSQEDTDLKQGIAHTYNDITNQTFMIMEDGIYFGDYELDVEDISGASSDIDVAARLIYVNGTEVIGSDHETGITKKGIEVELTYDFLFEAKAGDEFIFQFIATDADVRISTHGTFGVHPESAAIIINKIANLP